MSRRIEAIKLELNKAKTLMSEVDILMENKIYNTVIHTCYYNCFHATRALLLTKDFVTKTHRGISTILHQHFVQ